jgi:plastocyanin
MLKPQSFSLATLCLAIFPLAAIAATHDVSVDDNRFTPSSITISVGDTVRWTNAAGGNPHDVTADDNSFANPEGTVPSFVYSRTFNSVDEIRYYCTLHGNRGGVGMSGQISVTEPQTQPDPILINVAMSDAWFYPVTEGQGFFIIIWETQKLVFLSWFTYDTERPPDNVMANLGEPGHRWLTALGPYEGDTALLDVFLSSGMIFDSPEPPVETEQLEGASIEIVWTGCNEAVLKYDIPSSGVSGEIPIERIVLDNVAACEAAQP